jgi:hypothetical protein
MASLSSPVLLQRAATYATAKYGIGPRKKRFWHSDEIKKAPDVELCLKADPKSLLFEVALRELLPTAAILGYVFVHLNLSHVKITDDRSLA